MRKIGVLCMIVVLFVCSCNKMGNPGSSTEGKTETKSEEGTENGDIGLVKQPSDLFTDRDYEVGYDENESVFIQLNGDSASCDSNSVHILGSTVTITKEGTYVLSGTLHNGMVVVNAGEQDKLQIVLNGVEIHSETSAPIYILEGDKVFLTLGDGTTNILSNGGSFVAIDENNIDSVIFSKQDLTINGSGTLQVESPAGHGIVSKDDLVFTSGTYVINSAFRGVSGNDSVRIANVNMTIDAGKDGIHAENKEDASLGFVYVASGVLDIDSEGDGIDASAFLQIAGGTFDILSGGGSVNAEKKTSDDWGGFMGGGRPGGMGGGPKPGGMPGMDTMNSENTDDPEEDSTSIKGMKAEGDLVIIDGTFVMDCADDAIHSNSNVMIGGGVFSIATGDDGIHANETLAIGGGVIEITESYEGLEGLCIEITGGEITLVASDDGLNAAGGTDGSGFGGHRGNDMFASNPDSYILISSGTLFGNADGDGIDSNGDFTMTGGTVVVEGPTNGGNGPMDYAGKGTISGGTLVVTGSMQMAQSVVSTGEQGVLGIGTGNQPAGTTITITNEKGTELFTHTPGKQYSCIVVSFPELKKGESFTISVGDASGTFEAN